MTTWLLPLSKIHVDPTLNVSRGGRAMTEQSVATLAADIEENGQLEPVGVVELAGAQWLTPAKRQEIKNAGREYVLVFGFRRFAAVSALNKKHKDRFDHIAASLHGSMSLVTAELVNVAENWSREPPTDFDLTIACHRFVVAHKIEASTVGNRVNKSVPFVESCVHIVSRVAPDLLDHYKVNCSKEIRRRMLELAAIEAPTKEERYDAQRAAWESMENDAAEHRRRDPQGGMRKKPTKRAVAMASRSDVKSAVDALWYAHEVFDGQQWHPIDGHTKAVVRECLMWVLGNGSDMPVR